MKFKTFLVTLAGVFGILTALFLILNGGETEYDRPDVATSTPVSVVAEAAPLAAIDEARMQLDNAKRLLNEEEDRLLSEVDERETRLEDIRSIRLSFTEAPSLPE